MILAALLGLVDAGAEVGPPAPQAERRQTISLRWDAQTKACVPTVRGVDTGDIESDRGREALVAALPDKGAELHVAGTSAVPYACSIALVDALKHGGYYGRIGFVAEPAPAIARP